MVDYKNIIQNIIESVMDFTFEYDIEEALKNMQLSEVSKEEIENLGKEKVEQNFSNGLFKIRLNDGKLIDNNSIYQYCIENNIKQPILYLNPNFIYVRWEFKDDLSTHQIKKEVKNLLSSNSEINLKKAQTALINEEIKDKEAEGYIGDLPIKTSTYLQEGKLCLKATCSRGHAIEMINSVIQELESEREQFVKEKIKRDKLIALAYILFILIVVSFWYMNNQNFIIQKWASTSIAIFLFVVPLTVLRLINYSFTDSILFRNKAEKKYEKEFDNKSK